MARPPGSFALLRTGLPEALVPGGALREGFRGTKAGPSLQPFLPPPPALTSPSNSKNIHIKMQGKPGIGKSLRTAATLRSARRPHESTERFEPGLYLCGTCPRFLSLAPAAATVASKLALAMPQLADQKRRNAYLIMSAFTSSMPNRFR